MRNMKDVLASLESDKVKDRQAGLDELQEVFSRDKVLNTFHIKRDGKAVPETWLPVFRALFAVVRREKDVVSRKYSLKSVSISAALKRLSEAASVVRWLIGRTVHLMNMKVVKECIDHLARTMHGDDSVYSAVALHYSKALRCIVAHRPHLEHLNSNIWLHITTIGLNVILGDPIDTELGAEDEDDDMDQSNDVNSDMFVDDSEAEMENEPGPSSPAKKGKKRSRVDSGSMSPRKSQTSTKRKRSTNISVSLEQVEFISILRLLLSTPTAPLLDPKFPFLPGALLLRLQRFLELYPTDSSLLRDYISILSSVLDHLSLNKKHDVEKFALSTWDGLIGLWGTKDKNLKEALLVVIRHLFHFVTAPPVSEENLPKFDWAEGINSLWNLLDAEAENRWGVDGLTLDALRLEISEPSRINDEDAFSAKTFRAGWNFDSGQALSWAILELQADCAAKLFQVSESMHSTTTPGPRSESKRIKLENPITSLLHSIQTKPTTHVRCYHLQILLFFIDRHWSMVHDSLKKEVMNVLLQFVAFDDASIQSWVFLNFAAIAYTEGSTAPQPFESVSDSSSMSWDAIWTHAIRRANVPGICRAACHTGSTLLAFTQVYSKASQGLIAYNRILLEIETWMKDMDVQGPSYPFDSVCSFLVHCLTIASQDVRLYRMHLEDKVLGWFVDSWKILGNRTKMAPHTVKDIIQLLETICGLPKRAVLTAQAILPRTEITTSMIAESKVVVIRDFVLHAKLPPFKRNSLKPTTVKPPPNSVEDKPQSIAPRGRERKISSFFMRTLETLVTEWELFTERNPTAEMARRSLDFALAAITFESLLALNGTTTSRQVLQHAGKIMTIVAALLLDTRWVLAEKILVAQAFELLVFEAGCSLDGAFETLARPGPYSGIKEQLLQGLVIKEPVDDDTEHVDFLRQVWQNPDFQEIIGPILDSLRSLLERLLVNPSNGSQTQSMDVDEQDGFGPIRTTARQNPSGDVSNADIEQIARPLLRTCICVLACGPFLRSSSGNATRDQELAELIVKSSTENAEAFCTVCPIFFHYVRQKTFHLPPKLLSRFLDELGLMLQQYSFSKSPSFLHVLVDFLASTIGFWNSDDEVAGKLHSDVRDLYAYLSQRLIRDNCRSWTLRDALARFLGKFLAEDPTQASWSTIDNFDDNSDDFTACLPTSLLPKLNADQDIRVRFRAAVVNAELFAISHHTDQTPLELYERMKQSYTISLDEYELMLTRLLALGNVLVVSSAVRRGAYWHMLETCLHSSLYSSHIEAILVSVSERLGMPSLSILFEAYASQLAYSLRQAQADFLRFPPHLLGYRDRTECAAATFHAFTPSNILSDGEKLFEDHCQILQKDLVSGLTECFGEIIGVHIVSWIDQDGLEQLLIDRLTFAKGFTPPFADALDGITTTILRCLGDQDFSATGPIVAALRADYPKMLTAFQALVRYRHFDPLQTHRPNLPAFPTATIVRSLDWLSSRWGGFKDNTTYHVLLELIRDLHQTPLVNEQTRLLNAMSLWISYRQKDFEEPTIADTLIHGAALLLAQSDLGRAAQSMLEWIFGKYPAKSLDSWKQSRMPNMMIRIRSIVHDYSCDTTSPSVSTLGNDLVKWADSQMTAFARKTIHRNWVSSILPTWPQQPSTELAKLYGEFSTHQLFLILEDHRITSNKFRLVRRIHERALGTSHDEKQFAKTAFWRLKECIPSYERLQEEDIHAFAALLSLNHGQIGSLTTEQINPHSPRTRHRRNLSSMKSYLKSSPGDAKAAAQAARGAARDAITIGLLAMLDDDEPSHVFSAYETLRLTMAVPSPDNFPSVIPLEYRKDFEYLKSYRRTPVLRVAKDIPSSLHSDHYIDSCRQFIEWISLVSVLFSDALATTEPFFGQLSSILESDVTFAEQVLPILIHAVLQVERAKNLSVPPLRTSLSQYFTTILLSPNIDNRCVCSVVDIVLHLRYFPFGDTDALSYNMWLDVNFSLLAQSAIVCGAYTTALLFVELAAEYNHPPSPDGLSTEHVLYEIYAHIDEPDGFYGIKTHDLHQFLIKRFHHEKQWDKAFRFHGAALEAGSSSDNERAGLLESFHSFGFDRLAIDTLRNFRDGSPEQASSSVDYKLGWRTETWDLPDHASNAASAALYRSLRAIYRERDTRKLDNTLRICLYDEMQHLQSLGSENLAEIRVVSRDIMCLHEILKWRQDEIQELLKTEATVIDKWRHFVDVDEGFDFSDLEPLMATRIALVRSVRQREERQQIGSFVTTFVQGLLDVEQGCLLRLSQAARASGQVQLALNSVVRAQKLDKTHSQKVSEEFANVLWLQKEEKAAVQFLEAIVTSTRPGDNVKEVAHYAMLSARLGTWSSEACLSKPTEIWERYFSKSLSCLEEIQEKSAEFDTVKAAVFRQCAMFAERQYHATLKSPDALRWKVYVDRKTHEIEQRNAEITRTQSDVVKSKLNQDQKTAQKILQEDSELFRKHNTLRETLLRQAIEMHSRCLETSSDFDEDSAIRLCSLWFANFDDESVLDAVMTALERIPSRKLVSLAHQITARLSNPSSVAISKTQENLQHLVLRMCQEHPFHTLYQVYCISDHLPPTERRQSGRFSQSTQTDRGTAASEILDRLRSDEATGNRVRDIELLCDACLEWCKFPIAKNRAYDASPKGGFGIPTHLKILNMTVSRVKVPITTTHTPLDPTLKYDDCVWIQSYEGKFKTAGGNNRPKICICKGSDGKDYKQLFKGEGNDDLRQDAVMEQVFDLVNKLLVRDRETKRRELSVRGYKVIPLSSQAGMLEFVVNTSPLRDWLIRGHKIYNPGDIKNDEFSKRLRIVHASHKDQHDKQLEVFLEARKHFRPVMRHYFTERHKTSVAWFQMRLNYTRSVASTSIVGHVLGLGDRHVSNILLDNGTGEVVHIDLGIAFDQGKALTVPERVPFRMTADIVDGMGISGTAGVFQQCAEETLRVLRQESGVIMTVLEVFKHDPLHSWTASEIKVKQAQSDPPATVSDASRFNNGLGIDMASGSADEAADRALSSVARKLDKSLSVESTVNELIAEATDPMNLATIFPGWNPQL